jgi:hypothetical protein
MTSLTSNIATPVRDDFLGEKHIVTAAALDREPLTEPHPEREEYTSREDGCGLVVRSVEH